MTRLKAPKQVDVGLLAGVSRATVSQILNNKTGFSVPLETRQRVLAAAQQLGYVPNTVARNLRIQKTFTIGVVIQDINNPFYPAFVRGVQDIAEQVGYDVISYNTDSSEARERHFVDVLLRGRVDGVVGVFWHVKPLDLKCLTDRGIPVAVLGNMTQPQVDLIDVVAVNEQQAAREAVNHLIAQGYQRITMLTGPEGINEARVQGYVAALTQAQLSNYVEIVRIPDFTEACGYQAGLQLFHPHPPDAVFAANDLLALGLLQASREAGLEVPRDFALLGFDNIPAARLVTPTLTTVHLFQYVVGQRCAQLLMERLDGSVTQPQGRKETMPYELIRRDSA